MPQQLIYTSAPRGLVAGRSGNCTVARSTVMREPLMLQLEKFSPYDEKRSLAGSQDTIHACRVVDIRGSRYHILSRIHNVRKEFTGRTNFLAHHLVFTPEEIRQLPSPPVILSKWSGWVKSWSGEPQLFEHEDWSSLTSLDVTAGVPAVNWNQITGDTVNGYGLLEAPIGSTFRVDGLAEDTILELFAESLELLELRDPRRDFRATAWEYTFTTLMQVSDNPRDFRWRCVRSDYFESNRLIGTDCRSLADVRALRSTQEEATLARSGRQPPRFVVQPQNARSIEGEPVRLQAKAEGVPLPTYEWFSVDRANNPHAIVDGIDAEFVLQNPPLGLSRYVVRVSNSSGEATSEVATLSVERKLRLSQPRAVSEGRSPFGVTGGHVQTDEEIEADRERHRAKQAQARKLQRNNVLAIFSVMLTLAALGSVFWWMSRRDKLSSVATASTPSSSIATGGTPAPTNFAEGTGTPETSQLPLKLEVPETIATPQPNPERIASTPFAKRLPAGWSSVAIGAVSNYRGEFIPEKSRFEKSRFDLYAAADGFSTNGDNVLFVCKTNTGEVFSAFLNKPPVSGLAGIMVRESQASNSPFLFIGMDSEKIIVYRRDDSKQWSTNNPIPKINQTKGVVLAFNQTNNQVLPFYFIEGAGNLHPFPNFAVSNVQKLVGLVLSSGSLSNKVSAQFVVSTNQ